MLFILACNQLKRVDQNCVFCGEWLSNVKPEQGSIVFSKDSVFYPYYRKSFSYNIADDSVSIFFSDKTYKARFVIKNDSAFFYSAEGIDTSWKKK